MRGCQENRAGIECLKVGLSRKKLKTVTVEEGSRDGRQCGAKGVEWRRGEGPTTLPH